MPYSYPDDIPAFAKNKSAKVKKTVVEVFNSTYAETNSEEKARIAALAAMKNAEEAENKKIKKSNQVTQVQCKLLNKSTNNLKRRATFVVLEPQEDDFSTNDLHLDWYDAETVEDSCYSFNKSAMNANIFHMFNTSGFEFIESYILPAACEINEVKLKKGTWLATIEVKDSPEYDYIWAGILDGTFNGLSVQCIGLVEELED